MSTKTKMIVRATAMVAVTKALLLATSVTCLTLALPCIATAQEILPFPPKPSGSIAGRTMQELSTARSLQKRRLPADAPNILIILIDDVGPGAAEHLWRRDQYADADRIAKGGISYNRFHTTAMCSPTRAALLTGRNHHRVGNGQIAELANDWDGYRGIIPKTQRDRRRGAEGLRLQHRRLRQVAQHARRTDHRRWARSTTGRPATASSISTASSPAKPRSTSRTSCATRPSSAAPRRRARTIT